MRRDTIESCQRYASERGGSCLSKRYLNNSEKLTWRCVDGHRWEAAWANVKSQKTWCPTCARKSPYVIDDMQVFAAERGGDCLSRAYENTRTKLLWRCAEGHTWSAKATSVLSGTWCPHCAGTTPWTLESLTAAVSNRGGACVVEVEAYRGSRRYQWRCDRGHRWIASAAVARGKSWCPKCMRARRITLADLNRAARKRGGTCRATGELHSLVKVEWQCKKGHRWLATPNQVRIGGTWCPECWRERPRISRRLTLDDMQEHAKKYGGKCLSEAYVNSATKLQWQCAEGHRWRTAPRQVRAGTWCPYCAKVAKRTIADMQALAAPHGGRCLSREIRNVDTKLEWRCAAGHRFWSKPSDMKDAVSFCPECRPRKPGTLALMQAIAAANGGRCLSRVYVNALTHLRWICAEGHRWSATPTSIQRGSWCIICSRKNARGTLIARLESL